MADLSQNDWSTQLHADQNAQILDVRTADELEEGFIPNAIHMDIYLGQEFVDSIQTLDKAKNYYVYCRSGGRSAQACAIMNQLGFKSTYNLVGGFSEWKGAVAHK
jgi:rhodanese-related sulfurtransferase